MANPSCELLIAMSTATVNDWLDAAVDSVLAQIRIGEGRLVVRHDGVEPDWARAWTRDPRVTVLHSINRSGVGASLAAIVASGTEAYIARLDSDDISEPSRFDIQLDYLRRNPDVALVGSLGTKINDDGEPVGHFGNISGERLTPLLLSNNPLIQSSVMFRRDAYEQAGGYNPTMRMMEDYELWLRMALVGEVTIFPERLVKYRIHQEQATRTLLQVGPHLQLTIRAQDRLAAHIGFTRTQARIRRARWLGVQYAMSVRTKVMGMLRKVRSVAQRA